jgi:hypothetical protein
MLRARIVASLSGVTVFLAATTVLAAPCTSDADCDDGYACVGFGGEPMCQSFPKPQPKAEPPKPALPPSPVYESYGAQTAIADVSALGLVVGGLAMQNGVVAVGGVFTYWLATPIVHFAHRNLLGFASLGLRVFGPPGGAVVGGFLGLLGSRESYAPAIVGAAVGFGGALITVSVLDALVFAKQRVDAPPPATKETSTFAIAPYVAPEKRGASTGLSLTF